VLKHHLFRQGTWEPKSASTLLPKCVNAEIWLPARLRASGSRPVRRDKRRVVLIAVPMARLDAVLGTVEF
jgi:hypothetical protein